MTSKFTGSPGCSRWPGHYLCPRVTDQGRVCAMALQPDPRCRVMMWGRGVRNAVWLPTYQMGLCAEISFNKLNRSRFATVR